MRRGELKWWRIDDGRTDETIVIQAKTSTDAMNQFFECCAENCSIAEATESDLKNYGPGSGNGWFQN